MVDYGFLVVIVKKEHEESYLKFYEKHGILTTFEIFAEEAMQEKSLYYLGLEGNASVMFCSVIKKELIEIVMNDLVYQMGIFASGNGISFIIPISSIGGETSLKYFVRGQKVKNNVEQENHKEKQMIEQNNEYVLVSAVIEKGYSEMIMDVLNNIGLDKATILKARNVIKNADDDFLGIPVASEKEIVNIVVKKQDEEKVIKSIMKEAGMDSDAHSAVFSMPIMKTAGII